MELAVQVLLRKSVVLVVQTGLQLVTGHEILGLDVFVVLVNFDHFQGVKVCDQMAHSFERINQRSDLHSISSSPLISDIGDTARRSTATLSQQGEDLIKLALLLVLAKGGRRFEFGTREVSLPGGMHT